MTFISPRFDQYQHACVRDIAWLLSSNDFFHGSVCGFPTFSADINQSATSDYLHWLDKQGATFYQQHNICRTQYRRLGLYFEAMLRFIFTDGWRSQITPYRLREHNVQIASETGKTLGEIDLLLQHNNGRLVHVEAAVKFYLGYRNDRAWPNWIGPNARDRLDIKMQRLLHHQLTLLQRIESQEQVRHWKSIYHQTEITSEILIKGVLFTHLSGLSNLSSLPHLSGKTPTFLPELTQACTQPQIWCRASQLHQLKALAEELQPCRKLEWLTGPANSGEGSISLDQLFELIHENNSDSPPKNAKFTGKLVAPSPYLLPLLCRFTDTKGHERQLMIVDDHWPE